MGRLDRVLDLHLHDPCVVGIGEGTNRVDVDARLPHAQRLSDMMLRERPRFGVVRTEDELPDPTPELGPHDPSALPRSDDHDDGLADLFVAFGHGDAAPCIDIERERPTAADDVG